MKKQILIGLILTHLSLTINAQVYDTGDKVGIGTSTPSRKLDVNGVIRLPDNNQVEWGGINNYIYGNNVSNYICLTTNAIERIRIDNGGNVGIGTTSPNNAKLQIQGNGTYDAVLRLSNNGSNGGDWSLISSNDSWTAGPGNLLFASGDPSSANTKFVITKLGNVGIGAISPNNAKLQIQGNGTYDAVLRLSNNGSNGGDWSLISSNDSWTAGPGNLLFASGDPSSTNTKFMITKSGNVGIGTTSPLYKLDVCGTIRAKEVKVDLLGGCDFVFRRDYKLMDLKELGAFVKTNLHLPEIASEKEMIENGVNIKEFQMKLLQKIEELTLYTIEQNKKIEQQNQEIIDLKKQSKAIDELKQIVKRQSNMIKKIEAASK